MKVVKINKSYRNGTKEHFLVLLVEPYSNDDIDYLVEEWCESEPSGMNYGYTYTWVFVEDTELYNRPESQGGTWVLAQKMMVIRELNVC